MYLITPIILILVSLGMFFTLINPVYRNHLDENANPDSIVDLRKIVSEYDATLSNQIELKNKVTELIDRKNRISEEDMKSLSKLLPTSVDNVRLIIEIEDIVKKHSSVGFKSVSINKASDKKGAGAVVSEGEKYNSLSLTFTVAMPFDSFTPFLQDLESNLRLADVTSIAFTANEIGTYDFTVTLKTYWLK